MAAICFTYMEGDIKILKKKKGQKKIKRKKMKKKKKEGKINQQS